RLSNKSFNNPYIWPTRLDNIQLANLEVKFLVEKYHIKRLASIPAPLPGVDISNEDRFFLDACKKYNIECLDRAQVHIQTDSVDCSSQMNTIINFKPNMVVLPRPSTQWFACIQSAQNAGYYNLGQGRKGTNGASADLI